MNSVAVWIRRLEFFLLAGLLGGLLAGLLGGVPRSLCAQGVSYSVYIGAGYTAWSGPYSKGGTWGPSVLAGAVEWRVAEPVGLRMEIGGGVYKGDLGETGFFSEATTLSFGRVHGSIFGRAYPLAAPGRPRLYIEIGTSVWTQTFCDVDRVGGPGFLGGDTVDCDEWNVDLTGPPLTPTNTGANILLGVGDTFGRLGLGLRYEVLGSTVAETGTGNIHARALFLVVEWVFNYRP